MENILKQLIKMETVDMKKYIFFMLIKYSDQLKSVTHKHDYTPLIYIRNQSIYLVYEDEEFGIRSTFSQYEEILAILQILLNEGKEIFFLYDNDDEELLSKEEILQKINESLDNHDEENFRLYSEKLKYYEKG